MALAGFSKSDIDCELQDGLLTVKAKKEDKIKLSLLEKNKEILIEGTGNGPIDAFINALNSHLNLSLKVQ